MKTSTLYRVSLWLSGLILLSLSAHAQYLSNGSFENPTTCPSCHNVNGTSGGGVQLASPWLNGLATPDYFNACFSGPPSSPCLNVGVPNNFTTNTVNLNSPTPAHDGDAYAGVLGRYSSGPDCEYLQVQLDQPLQAGNSYKASMWVRKAYIAPYSSNNLGMYFSTTLPSGPTPLNVTPQVLETSIITESQAWTLIEGTFTAAGGEQYLTIGIFGGFQTQYGFPFNVGNTFISNSAYYLIDDVKVCDDPLQPLDPSFTYEIGCYQDQVTITVTANTNYPNSQYNLYETQPCIGDPLSDPCLVQPPLDIETGNVVTFTVPYEPGETYVIKHGNWDECHEWAEQRQLITLPDFEGSISTSSPICENEGVIITPTNIHPESSQPWILTVEGVIPGQAQGINPQTYYGCGDPGILDLSDPAGSGLYDTGLGQCPTSLQPDGTPYPFECDEVCEYYRIIIRYQVCALFFSDTVIVHVLCAPDVESEANPDFVCPGDPVTYCVTNPQNALNYQWYNQNGPVIGGNTVCTGPHLYVSGDAYYVVATDPSNGCSSTSIPQITEDPNCVDSTWCLENLVPNPTFASYDPTCLSNDPSSPFFNGCVTAWSASNGTPQLGSPNQNPNVLLKAKPSGGEGIFASVPLPSGMNVAGSINVNPGSNQGTLYLVATSGLVNSNASSFPTGAFQTLWSFDLSSLPSGWNTISLPTVVVNGNYSQLAIHLETGGGFFNKSRIKLDNICLERQPISCKMSVYAGPDQTICYKTSTQLSGTVNGGVGPYAYQWAPTTFLSNPTGQTTGFAPTLTGTFLLNLTVTDANGCTASDNVGVTVAICSEKREGVEGEMENSFRFAPNPASHQLRLAYQLAETAQLELYDLQGRVVLKQSLSAESQEVSLHVSGLPSGLYLARIRSQHATLHQEKIVIQR